MNAAFAAQQADLERLAAQDRERSLVAATGWDFASNDYLGLAASPELREAAARALADGVPLGAGGSRLLRGNHPQHAALEGEAADLFGSESALFFANGYLANIALFATLPQRGDLVVHDALVHASVHDGLRLGRADAVSVAHNDVAAYRDAIGAWRRQGGTGGVWIAVESLYGMDGDRAPLAALSSLATEQRAILVIDEAHATGVYGRRGGGLAEAIEARGDVITLHTLGKALGCEGALVCGPAVMTRFLVNCGRGFIFTTAPSPLMAAVARAALRLADDGADRRARLSALVADAGAQFRDRLGVEPSGTHIQPILIGDNAATMAAATAMRQAGFDVRGIRPPTVPPGTSRLRVSLTLNVEQPQVAALVGALADVLR